MLSLICTAVGLALAGVPPSVAAGAAGPSSHEFVEMFVAGVVPTDDGHTLVLVNPEEQALLPLRIGPQEALSIHGRLEARRLRRPLTHDLLDEMLKQLGGVVVRVQIDGVTDDVFTSSIIVRSHDRLLTFDARPSDAVALALGSHAPIFVARPVVDKIALHPRDFENVPTGKAAPPVPHGVLSL